MPAYLETEQELSRLARRAAGMRGGPRLLILPGIMGSSIGLLRKNGGVDITWFDPLEIAQGQLVKLALPAGNRYWATGVLRFAYERLRLVLRIAGFDAVFHPYDWRRDILWNGRELADRLSRERRQEVAIVGHSMGGLVARAALAHKGGERIARVIQLGTPNKGVFVAVQALRGTYPLMRRVAMLDLKHSADELARRMLTTLPGLCGLLPAAQLCKDFNPFDPAQWPEGPKPAASLLQGARAALAALPPPDERFRLIAGFGQDTVLGLRRVGRKLEFGRGPAGDGTVPLVLAHWPNLRTWYVEESHGSLPGNADVGRAVVDLVRADSTTALPRVLPRRRGVPTLWQEDLRTAPGPKIAWGDLSEREQREFLREFVGVTLPSTAAAARRKAAVPRPVELSFLEGSITQSGATAIVLGAFANVEPAGAAQAIDRMLHGAISDLARRRAISAAAGEVFVLPVGRRGVAPRLVVFAGLGHFGRYGTDVQRLAAANVTRTLALAGIENFSMVLWGTASGTEPADAARAQLEGVLTALADLPPEQRLKRITIVSRDAGRIAAARRVAEDLLRLRAAPPLLRIAPQRKPKAQKPARALKPAATPLAWLFVQESAAQIRVALLGPAPKATALVASRRLDLRLLEREHSRLVPGLPLAGLEEFGERLGQLLLPPEIAEALPSVKSSPLVIVHDTASAHWPWEVLSLDGWAPAATKGLSRRYAAEGMSVAKWREQRRRAREFNVLLVINPTGDLPGAVEEGERVAAMLTHIEGAGITAIRGADATRARLLAEFRSGDYDAIHFAGHAWFDPAAPAASGILCAGGRVLSGGDLASMDSVPALVFFNACESGRLRATVNPLRQLDRSVGLAEAFLRGGVANFIGTWWPVSDAAASAFATTLYRELARGGSIGNALNSARAGVRALPSADWANYLHYGSYDFTLKAPKA
jgi:CHAT domain/Cytosol aminopeptidase family, N-terminal domain/PGAP1-like protein